MLDFSAIPDKPEHPKKQQQPIKSMIKMPSIFKRAADNAEKKKSEYAKAS